MGRKDYSVLTQGTVCVLENCIIKESGKYVFYFDGFDISELDTIFLFTLYKDGKPISDTLSYSVESYAYRAELSGDIKLSNLLSALMNYSTVAKKEEPIKPVKIEEPGV